MSRIIKTLAVASLLIILCIVSGLFLADHEKIHVYDGFESDLLSRAFATNDGGGKKIEERCWMS
jgi:hypothetical protein